MRTIRVTGKGQIKVRPDTTRITMTLDGLHRDYGETLRRSAEETETPKDVLSGFGFERADRGGREKARGISEEEEKRCTAALPDRPSC